MKYFLFAVLMFFAGCTGMAKPETFNQRLLYVVAASEATANSTYDLYVREVISKETAMGVSEQLEIVKLMISNSRIAYGTGDTGTALDILGRANMVLIQLEKQLKEAQDGKQQSSNSGRIFGNYFSDSYQLRNSFAVSV